MKLTWLNTAKKQKEDIVSAYPDLARYISMLENLIVTSPADGYDTQIPVSSGKIISCKRKSVRLDFFPPQYSIGYERLNAVYILGSKDAAVIGVYFS